MDEQYSALLANQLLRKDGLARPTETHEWAIESVSDRQASQESPSAGSIHPASKAGVIQFISRTRREAQDQHETIAMAAGHAAAEIYRPLGAIHKHNLQQANQRSGMIYYASLSGTPEFTSFTGLTADSPRSLSGQVKALIKLRDIWGIEDKQMHKLLGYTSEDEWTAVANGWLPLKKSVDQVDRVRVLVRIDGLLYGIFRSDEAVRKWLTSRIEDFKGTPLTFMLQGHLRNLDAVADYLQGITDDNQSR